MEKMIAFCGLVCTDCPAHIATQKNSDEIRKSVAERWNTEAFPLGLEDINCDGCLTTGKRLIKFCHECQVRSCGFEKKVANCAHCEEYPCKKLNNLWNMVGDSAAKTTLEAIRKKL